MMNDASLANQTDVDRQRDQTEQSSATFEDTECTRVVVVAALKGPQDVLVPTKRRG